jgi:hypothetical protein
LATHFLIEAYRHGKPIAAIRDGSLLLDACSLGEAKAQDGVIVGEDANAIDRLIAALLQHRFPKAYRRCASVSLAVFRLSILADTWLAGAAMPRPLKVNSPFLMPCCGMSVCLERRG